MPGAGLFLGLWWVGAGSEARPIAHSALADGISTPYGACKVISVIPQRQLTYLCISQALLVPRL